MVASKGVAGLLKHRISSFNFEGICLVDHNRWTQSRPRVRCTPPSYDHDHDGRGNTYSCCTTTVSSIASLLQITVPSKFEYVEHLKGYIYQTSSKAGCPTSFEHSYGVEFEGEFFDIMGGLGSPPPSSIFSLWLELLNRGPFFVHWVRRSAVHFIRFLGTCVLPCSS